MSYVALYRKFRPGAFDDVKGQEHIVTALRNQIKADKVGHAYLFCGTRGTGKTTVAKIFAKAVNCEHPIDGSPCNECSICKAINEQSSLNVIEIDAASNNGVDNVRQIIEEVQYSPTEGKYKVYIIDEVHMLSIGAFNALLKTLEEPPSYVIFILATTEAHKLPITILSRCQRYDFKRIQVETIVDRLKELVSIENIDAHEDALEYIAKNADGALRDALSLLDQCNAFYLGETLTYEKVLDVLGTVDNDIFLGVFELLVKNQTTALVEMIDDIIMDGKDISQFVTNFTWFLRNIMLIKSTSLDAHMIDMTSEMHDTLRKMSVDVSMDSLLRYIRILSELSNQLRYATQKRVLVEMAFIKLCRPQMESNLESVLNRIDNIEKMIESGNFIQTEVQNSEKSEQVESKEEVPDSDKVQEILKALPEEMHQLVNNWDYVVKKLETPIKIYLQRANVCVGEGSTVVLNFRDEIDCGLMNNETNIISLKNVIFSVINKDVDIRCVYKNDMGKENNDGLVNIKTLLKNKISNIDIEFVD